MTTGYVGFISQFTNREIIKEYLPNSENLSSQELEDVLMGIKPYIASSFEGKTVKGIPVYGKFALIPLLPEYITRQINPIPQSVFRSKARQGLRALEEAGVEFGGLGSFVGAGFTGNGQAVDDVDLPKTTGNALTAWASIEATVKVLKRIGRDLSRGTFVVLGATGSVGAAISHHLAQRISGSAKLVLVARTDNRLKTLCADISNPRVAYSTDIQQWVSQADVLIVTTAAHNCIVHRDMPKPGCVIIDDTKPWNCDLRLGERRDILHIDAGLIAVPGIKFGISLDCPDGTTYACLAETIIHWIRGSKKSYFLGRVPPEQIPIMRKWAKKYGFPLAPFHSFSQLIPQDYFEHFARSYAN